MDGVDIIKYDVYRKPSIGLYTIVNDSFVFVPNGFATTKAEKLANYLKTDYLHTSIANTRLLGVLMVTNNHGILIPRTSSDWEYKHLKKSTDLEVLVLDTKLNALGNLIAVNDKGGVASTAFSKDTIKQIQDSLDIEVIQKKVAGYHQVGVMITATSHGGIIHPETSEEDIKIFSNVFGVDLEPATINSGIPFVSSGILANNKAIVVGGLTTGPEIMMLTRAFSQ